MFFKVGVLLKVSQISLENTCVGVCLRRTLPREEEDFPTGGKYFNHVPIYFPPKGRT